VYKFSKKALQLAAQKQALYLESLISKISSTVHDFNEKKDSHSAGYPF